MKTFLRKGREEKMGKINDGMGYSGGFRMVLSALVSA